MLKNSAIVILFFLLFLGSNAFTQQQAYNGTPGPIPGKIEAEDYDKGGEGVAYHDDDASNNGGQYRNSEGVDIEYCGEGGYNVGWMNTGEWIEYTINVMEAGTYTITIRTASQPAEGGKFHLEFAGQNLTGTRSAPSTNDWQQYVTVEIPGIQLSAGQQVMRLAVEVGNFNVNYFQFSHIFNTQYPTVSLTYPKDGDNFEINRNIILIADAFDSDGTIAKVEFFSNDVKLGEVTTEPYELNWTSAQIGSCTLYAMATDNIGAATKSAQIEIQITPPILPDGPDFSQQHGFYNTAFNMIVSWEAADAIIRYTLDGSDPRNSSTAFEEASPVTIQVDPTNTQGRAQTPAFVVRAYALINGTAVTNVGTNTYIFVEKVKTQQYPGGNWPQDGVRINNRMIDLSMDSKVTTDPRYQNLIDDALLAIPSICINTNLGSLFDPDTGIYVNPLGFGPEWERVVSIELIDPDQQEPGFQINGGLRIRGGYSRIGDQWKQALRLFFRWEYGKGKLDYPLFQDEGVSSFDCVDLRCEQNYSWSYMGYSGHIGTFCRELFSRDSQRDMGQPYTRTRYYHVYLDGMYWGLYETQERSEASYAESYFRGDKDDYDVVKVDQENRVMTIEATDGNLDAFNNLWSAAMAGFQTDEAYFRVQGKNPDGTINLDYPVLINIDNLIDYMLIIFYTGNFDSPVSAFGGNSMPNNFYGIYNRAGRTGYILFAHDAEHSLMDPEYSENSDYGLDRTGPYPCCGSSEQFNPQCLHQQLSENPEYQVLFSDHVYRQFFNHGVLTPAVSAERLSARRDEIDLAVIAESARWGDSKVSPPRTRDDDWLPAVNWILNDYFPARTEVVLQQLKDDLLYPDIDPPVFKNGSADVLDNSITLSSGSKIKLVNNNTGQTGTIYYTIDGTDPRLIGGALNPSGLDGGDEKEITVSSNTVLKARVKNSSVWSAVHEIFINVNQDLGALKITEIHYHPLDEGVVGGSEFEFLEFKNIGSSVLPLAGVHFTNGIDYQFPSNYSVAPGGFVVIASNAEMFNQRYEFLPLGEYTGQLDNAGERLTLVDASNDTLVSLRYNDKAPWPIEPDSTGQSLVSRAATPLSDPGLPEYWTASREINGSPGRDDGSSGFEEEKNIGENPRTFELDQNYPNPFNPKTMIKFQIPNSNFVTLEIYNLLGQKVATLVNKKMNQGMHEIEWNATDLASGVYLYRLQAGNYSETKKLILLR
jgi:hypothetical protein